MVRGRNTNGMVGFTAFFSAEAAIELPETNARFFDSDITVNERDSTTNLCSEHDINWIIGRFVSWTLPFASGFHRLNVRLARLRKGGSQTKSLRMPYSAIFLAFIGRERREDKAGCTRLLKAKTSGCVRGPPCCCINELNV